MHRRKEARIGKCIVKSKCRCVVSKSKVVYCYLKSETQVIGYVLDDMLSFLNIKAFNTHNHGSIPEVKDQVSSVGWNDSQHTSITTHLAFCQIVLTKVKFNFMTTLGTAVNFEACCPALLNHARRLGHCRDVSADTSVEENRSCPYISCRGHCNII